MRGIKDVNWCWKKRQNWELLVLPPYSPNLNLIERLWKFVKKQVLYSKYYERFEDFKTAITNCLEQTDTTHKKAIDSLLTLNFPGLSYKNENSQKSGGRARANASKF
jgi:hypothetical protein